MNEYYKDSIIFIRKTSEKINPFIDKDDAILSMLCFALALERVFKGILYDINPVYVLIAESFKDTAPVLYKNKFLPGYKKIGEININANGDVITYRKALSRVKLFSETANTYSSLLYKVSHYRDIISHCDLSKINISELIQILLKDFIPVIKEFSAELNLPEMLNAIETPRLSALEEISNNKIKDERIGEKINSKLNYHKEVWEKRKNIIHELQKAKEKTESIVDTFAAHYSYEAFECPACGNTAIITFETERGTYLEEEIGEVFLTELRCFFCDLHIYDYEELDYLQLEQTYYEEYSDDNYFDTDSDYNFPDPR